MSEPQPRYTSGDIVSFKVTPHLFENGAYAYQGTIRTSHWDERLQCHVYEVAAQVGNEWTDDGLVYESEIIEKVEQVSEQ